MGFLGPGFKQLEGQPSGAERFVSADGRREVREVRENGKSRTEFLNINEKSGDASRLSPQLRWAARCIHPSQAPMPDDPGPLARLSNGEWRLRPFFQQSDPDTLAEQKAVDEYLIESWKATYRFAEPWPASIKDEVDRLYKFEVKGLPGGMGCMQAAYQCLETIHPNQPKHEDPGRESLREKVYDLSTKQNKFNSVDLMMEVLQKEGRAGEPLVVSFDKKAKDWKPGAEAELLKMFDQKKEGVYFFGVSVAKGNHTVMLAVDNTPRADGSTSPRIFWLDQHTRGLTNDVTGKLGDALGRTWKDPNLPNRIWPLRPEQVSRATP